MIGTDTNILVYAHRVDSPWHEPADATVRAMAEGTASWAIPWPCVYEFLNVVTNPRRYNPPTPLPVALAEVEDWLASPSLVLLSESTGFFGVLQEVLRSSQVAGPAVHDARIAALCYYHGVDRLYSADRDFSRFANYVRTENPLLS